MLSISAGVVLPERWLERLLNVCADIPDQAVAVFCDRPELMPVRAGDCLRASSADIDALCYALAPRTLFITQFMQAPVLFVPAALREKVSASALDQMLLYCGVFVADRKSVV